MAKKLSIGNGLKKRQAIDKANQTMFLWVAAAAIALSIFVVTIQFMYVQMDFNNRVLAKERETDSTLTKNIENANKLKSAFNILNSSDENVNSEKVLSALPVDRNSSAFGAAIQNTIAPASAVQIQSLSFGDSETIVGADSDTTSSSSSATSEATAGNTQPLQVSIVVSGSYANIASFIANLEKVTRPISIDSIDLSGSGDSMTLNLQMTTFYQPKKTVDITTKVIK